jgi:HAD superfamily hydrolase (TIGR01509 family)
MGSTERFRALSIDLWFTTFYHAPDDPSRWESARVRVLQRFLRGPDGSTFAHDRLTGSARAAYAAMSADPHAAVRIDPARVVEAIASSLGATVLGAAGAAAEAYSAAGLDETPPQGNPEALELLAWCAARGVPTALVTNSARRAATWEQHLRGRGGPIFRHVVSSCDLGRGKPDPTIFLEAARRLGLPPETVLHVGDRWELDVVGARAAGMSAALYRGLWDRYPPGLYDAAPPVPADTTDVVLLDRLGSLADERRWVVRDRRSATG